MDGGGREEPAVEGARHGGGEVAPGVRERGEEGVEVVFGLVVEEDLEFQMGLVMFVLLEGLDYCFYGEERVGPHRAT